MRLLVVKLTSFGDVVHTLPGITDIAENRPDIEIDWLVEADLAPIAEGHPAISRVHGVRMRKLRWPPQRWGALSGELRQLRRTLKQRRYDLVVDFQGLLKSAALARLVAGAPVVGLANPREPAARRFYRQAFPIAADMHAVERSRRLAALALGYPVPTEPGQYGLKPHTEAPIADLPVLPDRFGVFLHGASWPSKLWPEARWRELAEFATGAGEAVVLPWGSPAERAQAERVAAGIDGVSVLPRQLTTAELPQLLARAGWVVGLDSGLSHYAAALGARVIWLYGPTDPGRTGPYGEGQEVIQSEDPQAPCRRRQCEGHDCMGGIAVERVRAALAARIRSG